MDSFERHLQKVLNFDHLEKTTQLHLKKVYSCLTVSMLAATVGAYIHLIGLWQAGFLSLIGSLGFMIALAVTQHNAENLTKRFGYLMGFTLCTGMGLGPLLDVVIQIDESIIATAFLGTAIIFGCFTMASLLSTDRKFLLLGGMLMSGLSMMVLLGFFNIFFGSKLIYDINLYGGLAIFCGFVLYDTQLIVEKKRRGDDDFIWHSVDLFIDFIQIFRRLLIILAQKEKSSRKRND